MVLQQVGTSDVFIQPGKRMRAGTITLYFSLSLCRGFTVEFTSVILTTMKPVEEALIENLQTFTAFARSRVGNPHLAEDVVQESMVKALASGKQPASDEDTLTWFYRILRHSIIDLYRRNAARKNALEKFEQELSVKPSPDDERVLCQCFKRLLPAIPENYRVLLQRIDLDGEESAHVASDLRLTRNNLTVRLHRARKHLREELTKNCRACAKHGCLDCTCGE
jgi:RNA polymerase sigma-70 factor (ECF subfamily)